jgi:hypothetical protein
VYVQAQPCCRDAGSDLPVMCPHICEGIATHLQLAVVCGDVQGVRREFHYVSIVGPMVLNLWIFRSYDIHMWTWMM